MNKENMKKYLPFIVGLGVTALLVIGIGYSKYQEAQYMSYPSFLAAIEEGQIKEVVVGESDTIKFKQLNDATTYETDHPRTDNFKESLLKENIKVNEGSISSSMEILQWMMSASIFVGVFIMVFKRMPGKGSAQAMALQIEAVQEDKLSVGFNEIAGNVEAKEQVEDIISFIKNPAKYEQMGAKMPRGMIFYGPPGTGKTLMAKAIAKEAGVPFFSVSGSDFVQLYVGVGASRVRELFGEAKKHQKAVIFIDEIDAIGKKRSQNAANSNDEKDQTLNALLTEMSGFESETGIIVIAATNRLDILDDALLRPGRFDRHIEIGYPDCHARESILRLHLKNKPLNEDVSIKDIAKQTVYFTGATLENLVNEAAILAANAECSAITKEHLDDAFYTVIAGKTKKDTSYITQEERLVTAYHEAGHALVTKLVAPENTVAKVTIMPTAKGAGGFSMSIPKDKMYQTKNDLKHQIQISLAGRVAEEIIFGEEEITTGASNDIEKATAYLKDYMSKYGMHKELGLINMQVLYGKEAIEDERFIELCKDMMHMLYAETKELLTEKRDLLEKVAHALIEQESLEEEALNTLIGA